MLLVLCRDPLEPALPDRSFAAEVDAINGLEIPFVLVDHDALTRGEPDRACRRALDREEETTAVYRGWMLTPERHEGMFNSLLERNIRLVNDPAQYRHAHHLPENLPVIEAATPATVWLPGVPPLDRIMEALRPFGDRPVILKDFVKSRKHEWADAFFIPSASDPAAVARVVGRFVELQDDSLAGGLVFREFVAFALLGPHPATGLPLTEEHRVFWLDGEPLYFSPYWDKASYPASRPPIDRFIPIARSVRSRFFTMDLARRPDDSWLIVELGDGQVSGLPSPADAFPFYQALASRWPPGA
jgi:hypothetical protein